MVLRSGGGGGGYAPPAAAAPSEIFIQFPDSETPVSLGGLLAHGTQQDGASSSGPSSTGGSPGYAYAPAADGKDYVCVALGQFNPLKHFVELVVRVVGGYTAPDSHEFEGLVGINFDGDTATGYETDVWFLGATLQQIRWDDPLGTFNTTVCTVVSGSWSGVTLVDNDVVRFEYDSTSGNPIMTTKLNGVTKIVYTDTSGGRYTSGAPGFAFFVRPGGTPASFCIKSARMGSLP